MALSTAQPLVSVILTSYNYEQYVGEAIRSVLGQTYRPLELIVVDDGSTDGSVAKIKAEIGSAGSASVPIKTIFKTNGGQASAFNAGFAQATGSVVAFFDSDDLWHPDRVERVVEAMRNYPGGAIYQHQMTAGNGLKRQGMLSADVFRLWKEWSGGVFNLADDKSGILFSPFLPTSGLTFPRAVLEKIFAVPENLVTCPDAYLTRTAIAHGPLVSIPLVLGEWRDHGDNSGKGEIADFEKFWLPNILPALNQYYEKNGLGLRLIFDPHTASRLSAGKMLGETNRLTGGRKVESVRELLENGQRGPKTGGDYLRAVLSDKLVSRLSRIKKLFR